MRLFNHDIFNQVILLVQKIWYLIELFNII